MIISVSRRTDIIALYSEWFIRNVERGYCIIVNPFNHTQKQKISLLPKDVDFFVFWTRYPKPIIKYIPKLDKMGYKYYFMITLTNYPKEFERFSPRFIKVVESVKTLSKMIGKDKVIWRYDPIIISSITNEDWHIKNVQNILSLIGKHVSKMIISFLDIYKRNGKFFERLQKEYSLKELPTSNFFRRLQEISKRFKIKIQTCSEKIDLSKYEIMKGACIDASVLKLNIKYKKDPYQRKECLCTISKDIGKYNTCIFGCNYCYASVHAQAMKYYISYKKNI